ALAMKAEQTETTAAAAQTIVLDRQALTIGVLSITAAILFVGVILSLSQPTTAHAIGMNASGGDYVMLTQQLTDSQEAIIIIDSAAEKIAVFGYDFSRKVLIPIDGFDLARLRRELPPGR
ncbi:MAG: hypothetical protein AB7N71_10760, partial [Phycisphaerae bacterium]